MEIMAHLDSNHKLLPARNNNNNNNNVIEVSMYLATNELFGDTVTAGGETSRQMSFTATI